MPLVARAEAEGGLAPLAVSLEDERDGEIAPGLINGTRAETNGSDAAQVGVSHLD